MSARDTVTLTRAATKPTADSPDLLPLGEPVVIPKNLGNIHLVRELGKGGMGSVWLARHELLHRDVAVKFLLNMAADEADPGFATFLEGARAAAALKHKGLNAVLNADVVQGVPFIVMDYVEGPTLAQLLDRFGALSPAVARVVLNAACDAVGELHDHGIVHRDIKPANILIEAPCNPVLTDFGLACMRPVQSLGSKVEGASGTPHYMAPEMFDRTVSARTDVYALGVMALELLAGHVPFDGSLADIRRAHLEEEPPLELIESIEPALADLLLRAMNKNAMFRLKTARHMQHAVEEAFSRMDPMKVAVARGQADLSALLARLAAGEAAGAAPGPAPEAATYYDRLTTLVSKRRSDPTAGPGGSGTEGELVERVGPGVVCARCGAALQGLHVTGRCPGCLLLVRLTLCPEPGPPPSSMSAIHGTDAPAPAAPPAPGESRWAAFRRGWKEFFGR
jgi:hypothetical protein